MNTKIRLGLVGFVVALFCAGSAFAGFKADSLESTYGVVCSTLVVTDGKADGYFMKSDANGKASWNNLFDAENTWSGANVFANTVTRMRSIRSSDTVNTSNLELMGGYTDNEGARLMLTGDNWAGSEGPGSAEFRIMSETSTFKIVERNGSWSTPFLVNGNGNTEILGTLSIGTIGDLETRFNAIGVSTASTAQLSADNTWTGVNIFANGITRAQSITSTDSSNTNSLQLMGGYAWDQGARLLLVGDNWTGGEGPGGAALTMKDASSIFQIISRAGGTPFKITGAGNAEILGTLSIGTIGDLKTRFDAIGVSTAAAVQLGAANTWTQTNTFSAGISVSTISATGDITAADTSIFYFGDASTDGTWRIKRDTNDLVFERRESSAWVKKSTMIP